MDNELNTTVSNYIILEDHTEYLYTITPFEFRNVLDNVIAILQEFRFVKQGENAAPLVYKLYKTKDGNWYDITDNKSPECNLLRSLKLAIDKRSDMIN